MNLNLNALAAAVGLALVAGQASAAINAPNTGNTSELFAVVYDAETGGSKASFTLDLGLQFESFLPTPTAPASLAPFNLTANSNWADFLSKTDGTPQLRFLVVGADTTGGTAVGGQRYMGTGVSNPFAGKTNTQVSTNFSAAPTAFVNYVNLRGTNPSQANGSVVLTDNDSGNFGKSGTMTPTWNGVTGNMSGALGSSLNFYMVQRTGANGNGTVATTDQFDNLLGPATWSFKQAGNGDYVLAYTAPVPEPESWALMLAGMALVGSVARRRRAK